MARPAAGGSPRGRGSVHALAQQFEEALLRHRRRDESALAEIATHHHQRLQIGLAFDAFGRRGAAEAVRKIDRGLADRGIGGVDGAVADEGTVDLEFRERQIAQAGKRRIAGAEIVDRDRDAAAAQLRGDVLGQRDIARDLVLGDFKDETGPFFGLRPILGDQRRERHPQQARRPAR